MPRQCFRLLKAYDWRELKWSGLATGILTGLSLRVGSCRRYFKNLATLDKRSSNYTPRHLVDLGLSNAATTSNLTRKQFLGLYSFLSSLKNVKMLSYTCSATQD